MVRHIWNDPLDHAGGRFLRRTGGRFGSPCPSEAATLVTEGELLLVLDSGVGHFVGNAKFLRAPFPTEQIPRQSN